MAPQAVYLDYQASTPLDPHVRQRILATFDSTGNASAEEHAFGWAASAKVESARQEVATCVGSLPEEVYFTSGSTEANNIAVLGAAMAAPINRRRIIISAIEHKSVSEAAFAAERLGFVVEIVPVSSAGIVEPETLAAHLGLDVAVVSVMAVNNEVGTIQPVADLARLVKAAGAYFHVDATQALAAIDVDMLAWGADSISLSGHKIYGPGGVGALVVGVDAVWRPLPLVHGGGQERGLRSGTLPVPLCVGLGEACRLIAAAAETERRQVSALRDHLRDRLRAAVPGMVVSCEASARHPGCLHVWLPNIAASDLLLRLQPLVAAATGSACTSGTIGPSHVLQALGMTRKQADECVRFSIGRFTTREEIDFAGDAVGAALGSTRGRCIEDDSRAIFSDRGSEAVKV